MAPAPDLRPPGRLGLLREAATPLALARLLAAAPDLARQPRGGGEPVLVLPGFGTSDASTALLRAYLGRLGYRAFGWGLGTNRGDVADLVPQVIHRTEVLARATSTRVRLVGWSLGGTLARETARERPEVVERVVTMGTPVVGGPKYTAVARVYAAQGFDLDAIEHVVAERNRVPLRVPVTALYSRNDGVVAWTACIDHHNDVEHVEVRSTHLGLGVDPDVYRVLADRLARPPRP